MGKLRKDFSVFVGAETGLLKGVSISEQGILSKNFTISKSLDPGLEVVDMCWKDSIVGEKVLIGRRGKSVSTFDVPNKCFLRTKKFECGKGPLVSICSSDGLFVAASEDGIISAWRDDSLVYTADTVKDRVSRLKKRPATLSKVIQNPNQPNHIAYGGRANDLRVRDLNASGKCIFKAVNVPLDDLLLGCPVWISDLAYMPEDNFIACCTRFHHVRLYDIRVRSAAPMISFEWGEYPMTSIACVPLQERQVVVGTNHGATMTFDLRNKKPQIPLGGYRGYCGGVKQIRTLPHLPLIFTVSPDRFFRIHDSRSKRTVCQVYMKSRLNCLLLHPDLKLKDFGISSALKREDNISQQSLEDVKEEYSSIKKETETQADIKQEVNEPCCISEDPVEGSCDSVDDVQILDDQR